MRRVILSFVAVLALLGGFLQVGVSSTPAQASGTTDCGGAICVNIPVNGGGGVDTSPITGGGTGSTGLGGGKPGSGSGAPAKVDPGYWVFTPCNNYTVYPTSPQTCTVTTVTRIDVNIAGGYPTRLGLASRLKHVCSVSNGKTATGVSRYYVDVTQGGIVTVFGGNWYCRYPSLPPQPVRIGSVTCTWAYGGSWWYSTDRSSIQNSGAHLADRGARAGDPSQPYISGGSVRNCTSGSVNILWPAPINNFGYYSAHTVYKSQTFTHYGWPAWTKRSDTFWNAGGINNSSTNYYYAYSCPNALEGPFIFNGLPAQGTRIFSPALCPTTHWVCSVNGTLDINGSHANQQLMRDGANIKVTYPSTTVIGTGFRNVTATDYKTDVLAGSTPYNSSDGVNGAKQYFKLKTANGTTQENFGTWYSNANANRAKFLSWYWASDVGGSFSITDTVRFTAEFQVPNVSSVGGAVTLGWKTDTVQCPNTPVVSNRIQLLRSVNDY